jgi:hypothetical protein
MRGSTQSVEGFFPPESRRLLGMLVMLNFWTLFFHFFFNRVPVVSISASAGYRRSISQKLWINAAQTPTRDHDYHVKVG